MHVALSAVLTLLMDKVAGRQKVLSLIGMFTYKTVFMCLTWCVILVGKSQKQIFWHFHQQPVNCGEWLLLQITGRMQMIQFVSEVVDYSHLLGLLHMCVLTRCHVSQSVARVCAVWQLYVSSVFCITICSQLIEQSVKRGNVHVCDLLYGRGIWGTSSELLSPWP